MKRYLFPWVKEKTSVYYTDVLVLGSGLAGLYTAVKASESNRVTVITKKNIEESNTEYAQGGIAVALDEADSPSLHYEDTLQAGAGLCDSEAVRILVEDGPARVEELIEMGANFDQSNGVLAMTREGAHSRKRILHAKGDATGWEIERTLVEAVRSIEAIEVREERFVVDLLEAKGVAAGALVLNTCTGELEAYLAKAIVLATGGLGQLFRYTTNPDVATGDGLAAAWRAGADLMDMEFVQFHPTALLLPGVPRFLISEAVRGEGAQLINCEGSRFMADIPGQELAPRDVVARAIWKEMNRGPVFLDFRPIGRERILERFPNIYQTCLNYGIDVLTSPVPVAPAAHYLMGGVKTNTFGETNLPNLYACGECACNGVHGANRLASNSLLDGLVFGARIMQRISARGNEELPRWDDVPEPGGQLEPPGAWTKEIRRFDVQELMWENVGILRDQDGLEHAYKMLVQWQEAYQPDVNMESLELANMLAIGATIAEAALNRQESRGGHFRSDFPERADERWQYHSVLNKEVPNVRCVRTSGDC